MWEIILGSCVQRPLEQFLYVTAGRCCVAFCALLGHRCGWEGNRCSHWSQSAHLSERIITSCFAFCLYGTWLLRVSVSGLATGARLWRTRSKVTTAVASAAFDTVGPLFNPPHPHSPFKGKYVLQRNMLKLQSRAFACRWWTKPFPSQRYFLWRFLIKYQNLHHEQPFFTLTIWRFDWKSTFKHSAVILKAVSWEFGVYLLIKNVIIIRLHKNQCFNRLFCLLSPCNNVRPEGGRHAPRQRAESLHCWPRKQ